MRLAAIYIPEGILSHVFGDDHKGQTLNLGGKYIYKFEEKDEKIILKQKNINLEFIDSFWLNDISLISAIVGQNGTGKTTILNIFREAHSFCKFIYETLDNDDFIFSHNSDANDIIYYSAFLNTFQVNSENDNFRDLSKYQLMIDDTNHENADIAALFELHDSENLKRWIKFIEAKNVENLLNEISLPVFDKINIKIHYFTTDEHETSYKFRPFFDAIFKLIETENIFRQQAELDRLKLTDIEEIRQTRATNKIRLELEVLKRIISKIQNILESSGNKYLKEGFLNNDYTTQSIEFKSQNNSKNAFYWFLENSYIQVNKKSKKIQFPKKEIINLIETLHKYLPEAEEIDNWSELNIKSEYALEILNVYEKFLIAFKNDFVYDKKILLKFKPFVNLSSGEKGMYDLFSVLNDLSNRINDDIHVEYGMFYKKQKIGENLLILLDEGDLGFHPEWKKKYMISIQQLIPFIFKDKRIQIIITTHDPLTLSDFPNKNVIYLKRNDKKTVLIDNEDLKSFGANVTDLLADSFFVGEGLIGDFSKNKIQNVIDYINEESKRLEIKWITSPSIAKRLIDQIGEPYLNDTLNNMFLNTFPEFKNEEIKKLEEKLRKLKE